MYQKSNHNLYNIEEVPYMNKPNPSDYMNYEDYNDALELYNEWLYSDYEDRYYNELYNDIS